MLRGPRTQLTSLKADVLWLRAAVPVSSGHFYPTSSSSAHPPPDIGPPPPQIDFERPNPKLLDLARCISRNGKYTSHSQTCRENFDPTVRASVCVLSFVRHKEKIAAAPLTTFSCQRTLLCGRNHAGLAPFYPPDVVTIVAAICTIAL